MGLDMYLKQRIFVGGEYEHQDAKGGVDITIKELGGNPKHIQMDATKVSAIVSRVGYWRKANAVHAWFVRECQGGRDECQESYVSRDQLRDLLAICERVLRTKDPSALPPQGGFFFGSTDIDQWYWQDIVDTIAILEDLPEGGDFYYQASW